MRHSLVLALAAATVAVVLLDSRADAKPVASHDDDKGKNERTDVAVAASDQVAEARMDAVAELGVPRPASLFSQSFALRRVSPLEFGHVARTASGVPIYRQPNLQKRGGSVGYGGVYPIDEYGHGGDDDGFGGFGDEGPQKPRKTGQRQGSPVQRQGSGGNFEGFNYDDYDYGGGDAGGAGGDDDFAGYDDYDDYGGSDYGGSDYDDDAGFAGNPGASTGPRGAGGAPGAGGGGDDYDYGGGFDEYSEGQFENEGRQAPGVGPGGPGGPGGDEGQTFDYSVAGYDSGLGLDSYNYFS